MSKVRAKFVVTNITEPVEATRFLGEGKTEQTQAQTITLIAVTSGSKENEEFYVNTPGGTITLNTVNVDAAKQFEQGAEYYIDFTRAK
jgi:hypothetical protein